MSKTDEKALVAAPQVQLGTIQLASPRDVIVTATAIATELAKIIEDKKLYVQMRRDEKYVVVEGWETLGSMVGITPKERLVNHTREEDPDSIVHQFEAYVDLVRNSDGLVIGGASAICRTDEVRKKRNGENYRRWSNNDLNAPRSMAITRATSKALRIALAWIMVLGGYKPTPAEEMENVIDGEYTETNKNGEDQRPRVEPEDAGNEWGQKLIDVVKEHTEYKTDDEAVILLGKSSLLPKATAGAAELWAKAYQSQRDADVAHSEAVAWANEHWNDRTTT